MSRAYCSIIGGTVLSFQLNFLQSCAGQPVPLPVAPAVSVPDFQAEATRSHFVKRSAGKIRSLPYGTVSSSRNRESISLTQNSCSLETSGIAHVCCRLAWVMTTWKVQVCSCMASMWRLDFPPQCGVHMRHFIWTDDCLYTFVPQEAVPIYSVHPPPRK